MASACDCSAITVQGAPSTETVADGAHLRAVGGLVGEALAAREVGDLEAERETGEPAFACGARGRVAAQAPSGPVASTCPVSPSPVRLGEHPDRTGRGITRHHDEADPLHACEVPMATLARFDIAPAVEGRGAAAHGGRGRNPRTGLRVRLGRLRRSTRRARTVASAAVRDGGGEILALRGRCRRRASLIEVHQVAIARLGHDLAGDLLHLAVAAPYIPVAGPPSRAIRSHDALRRAGSIHDAAVSGLGLLTESRVSIRSGKFETICGCAATATKSACIRSAVSSMLVCGPRRRGEAARGRLQQARPRRYQLIGPPWSRRS